MVLQLGFVAISCNKCNGLALRSYCTNWNLSSTKVRFRAIESGISKDSEAMKHISAQFIPVVPHLCISKVYDLAGNTAIWCWHWKLHRHQLKIFLSSYHLSSSQTYTVSQALHYGLHWLCSICHCTLELFLNTLALCIQPEIEIFQYEEDASYLTRQTSSFAGWLELFERPCIPGTKTSICLPFSHDPCFTLENTGSPMSLPQQYPIYRDKSRLTATNKCKTSQKSF